MKRIILDVDTGIDDALAIIYAIKAKDLHIEGITTGFGNVSAEQATINTLKVVELANPNYHIPVAMGAKKPLFRPKPNPVTHVHGENGIGNAILPEPKQQVLEEEAADFIVRMINENVYELTLVFVGRLTNLALALQKDPSIAHKVKGLVLMGGTLKTSGNVTPFAEANIYGDPEAASQVFMSGIPITMVGLDATKKANFQEEHLETLLGKLTSERETLKGFINQIVGFGFEASLKMNEGKQRLLHDPLAVGVVINPEFVVTGEYNIFIETEGKYTTGATLADFRKPQSETNASVCLDVNKEAFIKHFINTITN